MDLKPEKNLKVRVSFLSEVIVKSFEINLNVMAMKKLTLSQ